MDSFPQITIKHNIGNTIEIPNQIDKKVSTYISNNISAGVLNIPSDNTSDFTAGEILLLLSSVGAENAEIVKSTSHDISSFVTEAITMYHSRGDLVTELKYDMVDIYKSSSINGVYALLESNKFQITQQNTVIFDPVGASTDYYKVQWKNSVTLNLSQFSSPVSVSSYPINSVANIIFPVLKAMGISTNDSKINVEFCISSINDARKYTSAELYGIRHAWLQEFEFPIKVLAGTNYVELPIDIDFNSTDRSMLSARFLIGNIVKSYDLTYIDKRTWNNLVSSSSGGSILSDVSIGDIEIQLDNVGDFPDSNSGVAYIATTNYNEKILQIEYTSIDKTLNKLIGVTGITRNIATGTKVWSVPVINQPSFFTVYDNKIYFDSIIPDSMQGTNLYIDYYKKLEEVTSLYQELQEPYREIYKWYLRYSIKYRKDLTLPTSDPDLVKFEGLVKSLFNNLYTGQNTTIITS